MVASESEPRPSGCRAALGVGMLPHPHYREGDLSMSPKVDWDGDPGNLPESLHQTPPTARADGPGTGPMSGSPQAPAPSPGPGPQGLAIFFPSPIHPVGLRLHLRTRPPGPPALSPELWGLPSLCLGFSAETRKQKHHSRVQGP